MLQRRAAVNSLCPHVLLSASPDDGTYCFVLTICSVDKRLARVRVSVSHVQLCNPMDCSPPGSSVRAILQVRILEQVAIPFSRGSSQPRDRTCVSCFTGRFFTVEPPGVALESCCLLNISKSDTIYNMITLFTIPL